MKKYQLFFMWTNFYVGKRILDQLLFQPRTQAFLFARYFHSGNSEQRKEFGCEVATILELGIYYILLIYMFFSPLQFEPVLLVQRLAFQKTRQGHLLWFIQLIILWTEANY